MWVTLRNFLQAFSGFDRIVELVHEEMNNMINKLKKTNTKTEKLQVCRMRSLIRTLLGKILNLHYKYKKTVGTKIKNIQYIGTLESIVLMYVLSLQ